MNGPLLQLIQGLTQGRPDIALAGLVVGVLLILICFPVHEFSHALVATALGDDTARQQGRLTLNPLAHLDPIGTLLFLVTGFGWAKPVPVLPYRLNGNARTSFALVSLAGPASNVILAVVFALLYRLLSPVLYSSTSVLGSVLLYALEVAVFLNMILALFNLIPVPPLDGSRILAAIIPDAGATIMDQLERYGMFIVLLLSVSGVLSPLIIGPANNITSFLLGI
jgi:Zn-dependent protease